MDRIEFTKEMKKTHTILIPRMLPIHFEIFEHLLRESGYKVAMVPESKNSISKGLECVHNDTCYPALIVIGAFIEALDNGLYDPDKTALLITQTGGGCRASNYIFLLRKALKDKYPQVPVISVSLTGLEKNSGFKVTLPLGIKMLYAVFYGDIMMTLYNQIKPYEINEGEADKLLSVLIDKVKHWYSSGEYKHFKKNCKLLVDSFGKFAKKKERKPRIAIVGEIYVKFSPPANNYLEKFLLSEGCEPVLPTLMEFCTYCVINTINDARLYGKKGVKLIAFRYAYKYLIKKQRYIADLIKNAGFIPFDDFEELRREADELINQGVKMGEGWMIPAEMGVFAKHGVSGIICAQPFGCLPNHIVGKGMIRPIRERYPDSNIVAIDYDPGTTAVNQENRIKLMLSNIKTE